MSTDAWGRPLSATSEAAAHWNRFLDVYFARTTGGEDVLREVVEADPTFAVGRAMGALLAVIGGVPGIDADAELTAALAGRADHDWERSLVSATRATVRVGLWASYTTWLQHNEEFPDDLVGLDIAVFFDERVADPDRYAKNTARLRRAVDLVGDHPALLGYLAMNAQDLGDLDEAHRLATKVLDQHPASLVGAHPLAHVYFETGDHVSGLAWLDGWLPSTDQAADLTGHLRWHAALHELALGDGAAALARYVAGIAPITGKRISDATSLLWRCQLSGLVPYGSDPVAQSAGQSVGEAVAPLVDGLTFVFTGAHIALGLASAGDADGLRRLAAKSHEYDVPGAADVLPDLVLGLASYVEGDSATAADLLLRAEPSFIRIGGSNAQREVFDDTVIRVLIDAGRLDLAADRLKARLDRRDSQVDSALLAQAAVG
ncbi:hypothetical protein [Nocardioides speluncae]|uniref:hypothetical protein n=1 Tax=Nocardioides speluncae TaxID=2670337 RepID=UPI000D69CA93|nr:hypothetical protein [Nocardioides speluncae]